MCRGHDGRGQAAPRPDRCAAGSRHAAGDRQGPPDEGRRLPRQRRVRARRGRAGVRVQLAHRKRGSPPAPPDPARVGGMPGHASCTTEVTEVDVMACVRGKADGEERIAEALHRVVDDLGEIGVQVAAYHGSELIVDAGAGLADEGTGRSVGPDTVFNIFSITKAVIATAVHMLAERGHIEYQAPVARYWPEFAANGKADALVIHALSHRIGLPEMPPGVTIERMCDWDDMVASIAAMAPTLPIGRKTPYHGYTFGWIVGELVRRGDPQGRRVDRFVADEICAPLGIDGLWLGIPPHVNSRVAIMRDDIERTSAEMDPVTLTPAQRVLLKAIPPSL